MTTPQITLTMQQVLQEHAILADHLGIPPVKLGHRLRGGTIEYGDSTSPGTAPQNRRYKGKGPNAPIDNEFVATYWVWWVHQPFIRGLERPENFPIGVAATPWEQCQIPSLDIDGNWMTVEEEDIIIDAIGIRWRIINPTLSPDLSYWSFLSQRLR